MSEFPDRLAGGLEVEPVERLRVVVHQGPILRNRRGIATALRGLSLRWMRPFISYQERVNVAVVEAVEALEDRTAAYQLDIAEAFAEERRRLRKGV
jgi:hypothetical protein